MGRKSVCNVNGASSALFSKIKKEKASAHGVKTSLLLSCYLLKLYVGKEVAGCLRKPTSE